jgi:hypothetical protein
MKTVQSHCGEDVSCMCSMATECNVRPTFVNSTLFSETIN